MEEKRSARRLPTDEQTFLSKDNGNQADVRLIDISIGGMRVLTHEELTAGTKLLGQFKIIPNAGPFYIQGEIVWAKPAQGKDKPYRFEIGIKFKKISTIPL